jgi:hypothetical protein
MHSVNRSDSVLVLAGTWFGGRRSKLSRATSTARLFLSVHYWKCRMPLPFQLGRECCNFAYRIRATLQSRLYRSGVSMGQPHRACEGLTCSICAETRGRTLDMQRLCTERPKLTCLDWEIFLLGWKRGSEFRRHIHNGKLEVCSLATSEKPYYAKPQPVVVTGVKWIPIWVQMGSGPVPEHCSRRCYSSPCAGR